MAGRKGSIAAASKAWSFVFALVMWLIAQTSLADPTKIYDLDLRTRSIADALNGLSEQTGVPVVFSYDLVKDRNANPVVGRHTLLEALDELLKDTGLSGGLSDKGVVTVSLARAGTSTSGETSVPRDENKQNTKKTRVDKRAAIASFFASIVAAFSASAEDASNVDHDQANMSSVVVTAQKREERQQDVPVAMTVLDSNSLSENGQNRILDYFATVPGLSVSANSFLPGAQYITIRGLSTGYLQNPTTATVIDDVPTGSSSLIAFGPVTSPDVDPGDLARVEVLKGPQGTLYGADSMGGLVKYVTVDPSTVGYSGRSEVSGVDVPDGGVGYSVHGAVNIPVSNTFAVRISGFDRRDPGYTDDVLTGRTNVNSADVYGGRVAALWRPADDVSLKVSALIQQTDGNGPSYFNAHIGSDGSLQPDLGYLKFTEEPFANQYSRQQQLYSATVKAKIADVDLVSVSGYSLNKLSGAFDFGSGLDALFSPPNTPTVTGNLLDLQLFKTDSFSQEVRLSSSLGSWLDWLVGGFYTRQNTPIGHENWYTTNPVTNGPGTGLLLQEDGPLRVNEYAVFGDLTVHIVDRFDVQLGGRESWNNQTYNESVTGQGTPTFYPGTSPYTNPTLRLSGNAFTYLVTPQFKFTPDLMAYARVASGYRIGGPNLNAEFPGIPVSYRPDTTRNYELGFKGAFLENHLSVNAAVYDIEWHNFQISVYEPGTLGGLAASFETNAGAARSNGAELSVEARPVSGLTITAQGSYNDAKLTQNLPPGAVAGGAYGVSGDRLPYSVPWSGGFSVNQDIPLSNEWTGFVGGAVTYLGQRYGEFASSATSERIQMAGYTTVDLRTGARVNTWLFNIYVNNVADERGIVGYTHANAVGTTGGYFGTIIQPRTVGLSVVRTF